MLAVLKRLIDRSRRYKAMIVSRRLRIVAMGIRAFKICLNDVEQKALKCAAHYKRVLFSKLRKSIAAK